MDSDQLIDTMINLLLEMIQDGEEIPDELIDMVMSIIQDRTEELNNKGIIQGPVEPPKLEPGPFESSNVNSFKYDPENQQLFVKFHGKDSADSGPTYSYQGVPEFIFDVFRRGAVAPKTSGKNKYHEWFAGVTPSLGASMNALIKKGAYPYQKIA